MKGKDMGPRPLKDRFRAHGEQATTTSRRHWDEGRPKDFMGPAIGSQRGSTKPSNSAKLSHEKVMHPGRTSVGGETNARVPFPATGSPGLNLGKGYKPSGGKGKKNSGTPRGGASTPGPDKSPKPMKDRFTAGRWAFGQGPPKGR